MPGPSQKAPIRYHFVACKITGGRIGEVSFPLLENGAIKYYEDELQAGSLARSLNRRMNHPTAQHMFNYHVCSVSARYNVTEKKV